MNEELFSKLDPIFVQNMKKLLGEEFESYEQALRDNPVRGLRVNPIKINKQRFLKEFSFNLAQVLYEENGFVLESCEKLGNTLMHMAGGFYMQEPSSMMPVSCLDVPSDAKVLDLCASPGGKSTQVAVKIQDGLLVSNEIVTSRAKVLYSNIERMGVKNAVVLNDTPNHIAENLEGYFDAVLVDAPCGGEGMFRKDPSTIDEWSFDRLQTNHERQIDILSAADKCLKTGGILVYSTCTFSEIENEDVILEFLDCHNYEVLEVPDSVKECTKHGTKVKQARRFYPFSGKGEGQFVCVMQKLEECEDWTVPRKSKIKELSKKQKDIVEEFLKNNFNFDFDYKLIEMHNAVMLVRSNELDICNTGLNIINAGVRVGSIEKNIFKPHHQLFMALGNYSKLKYNMTEDEARKYVHGEELEIKDAQNGYYTMFVYNASIGGAKCSGNKLKNLYPKGLRI